MPHKVLFVDDEPHSIREACTAVQNEPFEIVAMQRGEEALQYLKLHRVDILISDQHMPGMQGSQLMAIVAKLFPDIVRIMLTGRPSLDITMKAINSGNVYRFLQKPFVESELIAALHDAAKQREKAVLSLQIIQLAQAQSNLVQSHLSTPAAANGAELQQDQSASNPPYTATVIERPGEPSDILHMLDAEVLRQLSRRECEILRTLIQGKWVDDLAATFCISPHTVRNHIKSIYRKIGVHSQAELLAKFVGTPAA